MLNAINLRSKLNSFNEHYAPRTVATLNEMDIMVVKARGALNWHVHDDTDDFFLVIKGKLRIETEAGDVELGPGELHVVPRGIRHRPVAEEECHILLIEPTGTPNTGDVSTAAARRVI